MKARNEDTKRFEQLILPHLNAGHNLARWLLKDAAAAQDVVQDSSLRAFAAMGRFADGNARAWFLTIVRNQCYTWLKESAGERYYVDIDDEAAMSEKDKTALAHTDTPEVWAERMQDRRALQHGLEALPIVFREVIVLKELEEMSYKEIAAVTGVPIGTVMSRLARGREMLKKELLRHE
jgi:RNA polymerase sigma factor (sigma-70 family)